MIKNRLLTLLLAFICLIFYTKCSATSKKSNQKKTDVEGYLIVDIKTISGKDSNWISARKMYLQNKCLIDIIGNENYSNGQYIKTDTLSYDFYDLVNQKYVLFNKLAPDAKIIKRGNMAIDGSFSNTPQYDPWNGIVDSTWSLRDTVINGKVQGVVNFSLEGVTDSLDIALTKKTIFWVDHGVKNFPLQVSYILSKKLNGAFVYKMQQAFPDGKTVMITSLDYQPAKLPESLTRIFERWTQIARE